MSLESIDDNLSGYDFDVLRGGSITGTVAVDSGGAPVAGSTVTACPYEGSGNCGSAISDANGDYRIGSLAGGDYRVSVQPNGNYVPEHFDDVIDANDAAAVVVTGVRTPTVSTFP